MIVPVHADPFARCSAPSEQCGPSRRVPTKKVDLPAVEPVCPDPPRISPAAPRIARRPLMSASGAFRTVTIINRLLHSRLSWYDVVAAHSRMSLNSVPLSRIRLSSDTRHFAKRRNRKSVECRLRLPSDASLTCNVCAVPSKAIERRAHNHAVIYLQ